MFIETICQKAWGEVRSVCSAGTILQTNKPQNWNRAVSSDSVSVADGILESENCEEDEFVQVFTSQPLFAVSSSYVSDHYG